MCLRDSGNFDSNSGKKADIYIVFKIVDLDSYNLKIANDYDLVYEYPIHIWDALSGHTIYLPSHPSGKKYSFKLNEVIKDDTIRYAKGLGLPNDDGRGGKFIIKFNYKYPELVLEHEKLKEFIRTKEELKGINKSEFSKEKLYDPEVERDDNNRKSRNTNSNDDSYDGQEGFGGIPGQGGPGGVQCAQS
jgi:DnaJ-class molecular chaperone